MDSTPPTIISICASSESLGAEETLVGERLEPLVLAVCALMNSVTFLSRIVRLPLADPFCLKTIPKPANFLGITTILHSVGIFGLCSDISRGQLLLGCH